MLKTQIFVSRSEVSFLRADYQFNGQSIITFLNIRHRCFIPMTGTIYHLHSINILGLLTKKPMRTYRSYIVTKGLSKLLHSDQLKPAKTKLCTMFAYLGAKPCQ
jgi:hypothetical protein